jgi:hypothetical protein
VSIGFFVLRRGGRARRDAAASPPAHAVAVARGAAIAALLFVATHRVAGAHDWPTLEFIRNAQRDKIAARSRRCRS